MIEGPRIRGREADYDELLGLIRAGADHHYGVPGEDADLDLLLGDRSYAQGLVRLAALGDLEAVAELADLISLVAQAGAAGDPELAESAWSAAERAIGWGPSPAHESAKRLARAGDPAASQALRAAAGGGLPPAGS